jgi:drug/metabolite transporter (DMT)-like permease
MTTPASPADTTVTPSARAETARPGVWLAELALLTMATIWAVNFSVIKYGATIMPPLGFNAFRIMLAALSLTLIALVWGGAVPARKDVLALLALGALGNGIYQVFFVEGLARTRAGEAALVVGASPALMAVFARIRGIERVDTRRAIGIALSVFGVGLVVLGRAVSGGGSSGGSLFGDLLVLCGAICWAIYTVLVIPYTKRISGFWIIALNLIGGSLILVAVGARQLLSVSWFTLPGIAWATILYSGLGGLVLAYMFWLYGIRRLGPTRTALYGNLQPLIALLFAWLTLGEVPALWQLVGAATIVGGVLLTRVEASEAT